ncbi:hypothetical protein R1flu_017761 [Riccia fluitans]|uniref:Uncharacterized protein n=1 Tax=Riccia fluitans TaxID=41844 RepID=A0ABD1ZDY6_9MARC
MDMEELEALKASINDYLRPSVDTNFDWDRFSSFLELVLKKLEEKRQERLLEKRCLSYLLHDLKLRLEREIGEFHPSIYSETNVGKWMSNNLAVLKTLRKNAKYRAVCDFAATRKRMSLQYNFSAGTDVIGELIAATK